MFCFVLICVLLFLVFCFSPLPKHTASDDIYFILLGEITDIQLGYFKNVRSC